MTNQGELLTKRWLSFLSLASLGIETYVSNIAISFYLNIVCKNVSCDVSLNVTNWGEWGKFLCDVRIDVL